MYPYNRKMLEELKVFPYPADCNKFTSTASRANAEEDFGAFGWSIQLRSRRDYPNEAFGSAGQVELALAA